MKKIKLSIIVVSLNTKIGFLKTINSIISQTNKDFEIIVIDGNSKDGTINEILRMKNQFSKYLIEEDRGIYDAMNKGVVLASGEWTLFLNSGDIFFSNKTLEILFSQKLSDKEIVFGNTIIKNYNLTYRSIPQYFNKRSIQMPFCHQSCIVKTNLLKLEKFNLDYKLSSDFNFFLSCYLKNFFFYKIDDCISVVAGGGIADTKRQQVLNENIFILKKFGSKKILYKLYLIKLIQFVKDVLKLFLPKIIIFLILKLKYRKKII